MNILILTQYFYPENFRINDLVEKLLAKGYSITVLTGMPNYPSGELYKGYSVWDYPKHELGVRVYRVPIFLRRKSKGWQLALNYLSFVVSATLLAPFLLRRKKIDIIFVPGYSPATSVIPAIFIKIIKKAKLIYWVQDLWPQSLTATGAVSSPKILYWVEMMMKGIYKSCDRVLVQSRVFSEPILKLGCPLSKIGYFPNWAEDLYKPIVRSDSNVLNELPVGKFIVMFAGNLGAAQSLDTVIDAAIRVKSINQAVHWVILGNGREYNNLLDSIEKNKLEDVVHLLGAKPMELMPQYFAYADVLLVTLRSDPLLNTTIPGKIQSYLACKKPIVAALDGEGARVIEESESGWSVSAGDSNGLAEVIIKISKFDASELKIKGANGYKYYKDNFNSEVLLAGLEAEMSHLIKGN